MMYCKNQLILFYIQVDCSAMKKPGRIEIYINVYIYH